MPCAAVTRTAAGRWLAWAPATGRHRCPSPGRRKRQDVSGACPPTRGGMPGPVEPSRRAPSASWAPGIPRGRGPVRLGGSRSTCGGRRRSCSASLLGFAGRTPCRRCGCCRHRSPDWGCPARAAPELWWQPPRPIPEYSDEMPRCRSRSRSGAARVRRSAHAQSPSLAVFSGRGFQIYKSVNPPLRARPETAPGGGGGWWCPRGPGGADAGTITHHQSRPEGEGGRVDAAPSAPCRRRAPAASRAKRTRDSAARPAGVRGPCRGPLAPTRRIPEIPTAYRPADRRGRGGRGRADRGGGGGLTDRRKSGSLLTEQAGRARLVEQAGAGGALHQRENARPGFA
jgi:hypothetical protein